MNAPLLISAAGLEIFISVAACAVLCASLFLPEARREWLHWGSIAIIVFAAFFAMASYDDEPVFALNGFFVASPFTVVLKVAVLFAVAGSLAFSRGFLRHSGLLNGEFYFLILTATLGMLVMISAAHLLSLYLGLETMSLSMYALIAMRGNNAHSSEAAIKYFILGALASGIFLYGISILYGVTGELEISAVASKIIAGDIAGHTALSLALVFMLVGAAFKIGAAPFHMWLPDVYQGAPAPVTLFIASAPKVAALAMMLRVLTEAFGALEADWRQMLMVLAVMSLTIGNITAIAQTNLKRMLAYSAIAHSGFIVLGVLAGGVSGVAAAMFYIVAYALMTVGGFGIIVLMSDGDKEHAELNDIKGLATKNAPVALVVLLLMFSMAGVPPVIGFTAKLAVLQAVLAEGFVWLAVFAVVLSVVGAFYYLRVIKLMFFDKPDDDSTALRISLPAQILLLFVGLLILLGGIFPGWLLSVCEEAARLSL